MGTTPDVLITIRRLAGLAGVARGAEPLADGTGVGLRRLGLDPARAGDPLSVTDGATAERFCERFKWSVIAPIEADRSMLARQRHSPAG